MDYRFLGASGFKVSALGFGTGTFGGKGPLFNAWGETNAAQARRLVDICLDAGLNLFDTADVYSDGESEAILGAAIAGRRDQVVLSTKLTLRSGTGPNDVGASRHHLIAATEASLKRLNTDYIDLLQLHHFDAQTPIESVMSTLDDLVRSGKVRYVGASNYSGWQLMKSQAVADRYGYARFVAHQIYYSLLGRDYEWELMPAGIDQGVGALVWSPLGLGTSHGAYPSRSTGATDTATAGNSAVCATCRRSTTVCDRRCAGCGRRRDGQVDPADCNQLVVAASDGVERIDRRTHRRAASRQSGCSRLGAESGASRTAGCGQCRDAAVSLLSVLERAVFGTHAAIDRDLNARVESPGPPAADTCIGCRV